MTDASSGRRRSGGVGDGPLRLSRDAGFVLGGALVFGFVFSYAVTTRLVFPMPPQPGDLFEVPDVRGLDRSVALDMIEEGLGCRPP